MSSVRSHKLFLGGLSSNISKSDLIRELSKFGAVSDLWIARNPPGFAFAHFERFVDAEKAVRTLDGSTLCDSKLRVEFAHNRSHNGDRSRPFGDRRQYIEWRNVPNSPMHRYETSPRRGRSPPGMFLDDQLPYTYDHLAAFYNPDLLNAAAVAAAAGLPCQLPGYSTMFPFLPSADDVLRMMNRSRRNSPRRSPSYHLRSRSPLDNRGRNSYERYREVYRSRDRRRPSPPSRRGTPSLRFPTSEFGSRRHHYERSSPPSRILDRRRR